MSENLGTGSESQQSGAESVITQEQQQEPIQNEQQEGSEGQESNDKPQEKVEKVVPLQALHEERNQRKQLQQDIARLRAEQAQRDEILNQRLARLMPQQREQVPDSAENPVGYIDHRIGQLEKMVQPVLQGQQQQAQQVQQQQVIQRLQSAVLHSAAEFAKANPDLTSAADHLNAVRARELVALGVDEVQAKAQAVTELDQALMQWAAQGRNPAQIAYEFAQARGYSPKAAQPTAQERIEAQKRGVDASKTLGGGGSASPGKLTAQALANMSNEDFAKLTESQWRQAMGG